MTPRRVPRRTAQPAAPAPTGRRAGAPHQAAPYRAGPARTDRIALRGLRARGRHGVHEHERRDGQEFVVDAVLGVDTSSAAAADDLSRTVDYGSLATRLAAIITGEPVQLIETLAQRLAEACLAEPAVTEVEITVHKPQAPIEVPFDDVCVTISRRRT